jgi:hypothetical protein
MSEYRINTLDPLKRAQVDYMKHPKTPLPFD